MNKGDIMAASAQAEKQILVMKLLAGEATQEERDKAIATVMLSLWGQDELRTLIKMVHNEECAHCPLKQHHVASKHECDEGAWQRLCITLVKYGGWMILIAWTIVQHYFKG